MTQPLSLTLTAARDLALKLLERRNLSAGDLGDALTLLEAKAREVLDLSRSCPGLPLLRLAVSLTAGQAEKGSPGRAESTARRLAENARLLLAAAETLPPGRAPAVLPALLPLILKLMETNALSSLSLEAALLDLTRTFGRLDSQR